MCVCGLLFDVVALIPFVDLCIISHPEDILDERNFQIVYKDQIVEIKKIYIKLYIAF